MLCQCQGKPNFLPIPNFVKAVMTNEIQAHFGTWADDN
jgi:hypothetical protein